MTQMPAHRLHCSQSHHPVPRLPQSRGEDFQHCTPKSWGTPATSGAGLAGTSRSQFPGRSAEELCGSSKQTAPMQCEVRAPPEEKQGEEEA